VLIKRKHNDRLHSSIAWLPLIKGIPLYWASHCLEMRRAHGLTELLYVLRASQSDMLIIADALKVTTLRRTGCIYFVACKLQMHVVQQQAPVRSSRLGEGLIEILNDVISVLDADRKADLRR